MCTVIAVIEMTMPAIDSKHSDRQIARSTWNKFFVGSIGKLCHLCSCDLVFHGQPVQDFLFQIQDSLIFAVPFGSLMPRVWMSSCFVLSWKARWSKLSWILLAQEVWLQRDVLLVNFENLVLRLEPTGQPARYLRHRPRLCYRLCYRLSHHSHIGPAQLVNTKHS